MTALLIGLLLASAPTIQDIAGEWVVDLRVDASKDAPYTKPMVLKIAADRKVSGSFYDSEIIDGRAGGSNGRACVAFRTSDGRGFYQTSGCLADGKIVGQSWSEERGFLLNWTATRK